MAVMTFIGVVVALVGRLPMRMVLPHPVRMIVHPPLTIPPTMGVVVVAVVGPIRMARDPVVMMLIDPVRIVAMPPILVMPLIARIPRAITIASGSDLGMGVEPMPQVRMARQVIWITHQRGIRLQFRMVLNVLLKILLRRLGERRHREAGADKDRAGQNYS